MKANNLIYEDSVLKKAIALEMSNVKGVIGFEKGFFQRIDERVDNEINVSITGDITKGISIEQRDTAVNVFCNIITEYNVNFPSLYEQAKNNIGNLLSKKFDLTLSDFYVNIVDLKSVKELENDFKIEDNSEKRSEEELESTDAEEKEINNSESSESRSSEKTEETDNINEQDNQSEETNEKEQNEIDINGEDD